MTRSDVPQEGKVSRNKGVWHSFEATLSVSEEDIEFELRGHGRIPWADFLLNPRRLRGSDFLMRWSQGEWSENRLVQAVNSTRKYVAIPYGPSSVAPEGDVRAFELYFERLEAAGLGKVKRPDLLIFARSMELRAGEIIARLGGEQELPFTPEANPDMRELLSLAVMAAECENSLWIAKQMPGYGRQLTPQARLGGQVGLPKSAVVPTVIIKQEDREPLHAWQSTHHVPIHIWQAFFDVAYGLSFDRAEGLIATGRILPTEQVFQAPGGATQPKAIYKFYYQYAYPLGEAMDEPKLVPAYVVDKNGHILPYVKFEGGSVQMTPEALDVLNKTAEERGLSS